MNNVQNCIIDIFNEFTRICKKHGLTYFAIGGTAIGAIRHHGFIPWDDDLDVAMPYPDYKRFIDLCKVDLLPPYSLHRPNEHRYDDNNFIKLQNDNTTFIDYKILNMPERYKGVAIDIMPIFGLPKGKMRQEYLSSKCDMWLRMNRVFRLPISTEPNLKGRIFWMLVAPARIFHSYNYYIDKIEKTFKDFRFDESDKVLFGWRIKPKKRCKGYRYQSVLDTDDFLECISVPFENTYINVPKGYDHYLTMDFGDYMTLPPIEEQVSPHNAIIDLKKSYKEFVLDSQR